jgi:hypothetical protein
MEWRRVARGALVLMCFSPHRAAAQAMTMDTPWMLMSDAALDVMVNHQGGPRGGDELKAPNWWMGMASRPLERGQLTLTAMLSLDPATVGKAGYRELFQQGEALDGKAIVDRQHPHDLFMQLAAVWRVQLPDAFRLTIAGGPVGEPALGPVAFMHRASAETIPMAPLSHHTFDSTHVSFGVATAGLERGAWAVEGSVFNGREPDDNRWDFDFAKMNSIAGRVWFRPSAEWAFQVSTGHLVSPEELVPGNIQRTTASGSWFRRASDADFSAVTVGYGVNAENGGRQDAVFAEATRHRFANAISVRAEWRDHVGAVTVGGARDVARWRSLEGAIGADVTIYAVPDASKPSYGSQPISFQIFVRLRPTPGHMGRMWNREMARPF